MDSPRKQLHSRVETRISDISCLDSFNTNNLQISNPQADMSKSFNEDHLFHHYSQHQEECQCHRSSSPFNWSTESNSVIHQHTNNELDSNYGCGDTTSVSEMHDIVHNEKWTLSEKTIQPSMERCMSCISKLGAPSMSRSSTATVSGTPCANGPSFNPAWTMENQCPHRSQQQGSTYDRMSVCSSHGSSSGNSEYSVPRYSMAHEGKPSSSPTPPLVPPKSPKSVQHPLTLATTVHACHCPPSRPPKPLQLQSSSVDSSPIKKKLKKPPMPLPITTPLKPENQSCRCQPEPAVVEPRNLHVGPYENYDVPKLPFLVEPKPHESNVIQQQPLSQNAEENYDTPKKILECLASSDQFSNSSGSCQTMSIRKPCGCVLKFNKKPLPQTEVKICEQQTEHFHGDCVCRHVTPMCWPGSWMTLPYCRRGSGIENTSFTQIVDKTDVIYATVDKSKKTNRRDQDQPISCNYANIEPLLPHGKNVEYDNYENIDFAQSLEYYENAKQLLQKAGITPEELNTLSKEEVVKKVCQKCGHSNPKKVLDEGDKSDDYLMMEPGKTEKKLDAGYIPMSPINNTSEVLKQRVTRLVGEKSASNPNLIGPPFDRSRKRSDSELRIPGAAMLMLHHTAKSPYTRKQILDSSDCIDSQKTGLISRKRSSSADSSRYVEEDDLEIISRTTSPSTETLRKSSLSSLTNNDSTQIELLSPCLHQETEPCYDYCRSIDVNSNETDSSLTSDSSRTQVTQQAVNIRRSSSVPCKSGQNRDSSSSNDSGVSTGSLKHRGADFAEFELPLTTSMSSRRHDHYTQRLTIPSNCLHSSLPRRWKSSDPLRELTFQFQKIKIPAKSSSAEAEVPICSSKGPKGYGSPADSTMGPPYIDSRSTSSGTSDMSDYIETLSLSSHSSSDATDLRLIRQPTTTLRPRSGKEYHNIDRSKLVGSQGIAIDANIKLHPCSTRGITRDTTNSLYANITPVPEKSESPSPGYQSGSSPIQEHVSSQCILPDGTNHFKFQKMQ